MDMFESRAFIKGSDLLPRGLSFAIDTLFHYGGIASENLSTLFVKSYRLMNWATYPFPFTYERNS